MTEPNRDHVGGYLSGNNPVDSSVVPTGPAPGAQHRERTRRRLGRWESLLRYCLRWWQR